MIEPSGIHAEIYGFMVEHFRGVENAAPRAAIIQRFGLIRKKVIPDRAFRNFVSELVSDYKKAICTTPADGYFVARTPRERDQAVADLRARAAKLFERAKILEATETLEKQERLF